MDEKTIMPIQPIKDGRFVSNKIVEYLLEVASVDLNDIAIMPFSEQERIQFAQLIGYSLGEFSELSYTDSETYMAAEEIENGKNELEARNMTLRKQLSQIRNGLKIANSAAFNASIEGI